MPFVPLDPDTVAAMSKPDAVPRESASSLRQLHYNAHVDSIHWMHGELMVLRVRPAEHFPPFVPGQYAVLGLGYWEPRIQGAQSERLTPEQKSRIVKRPYSLSCRLVDNHGNIILPQKDSALEFYIALIRRASSPPALTPRLFALRKGDSLYLGPSAYGRYTLPALSSSDQLIFAATGTGEAPHNAMIAELLLRGHQGEIVCVTCVRHRRDLGYLPQHQTLQQRFPQYRYIGLTTREPENIDPRRAGYVGKQYLQDLFSSGRIHEICQQPLSPKHTHIFLCGNPDMIGAPLRTHNAARRYPQPTGMVEVLERCGFHVDRPHEPGNIHFETYW